MGLGNVVLVDANAIVWVIARIDLLDLTDMRLIVVTKVFRSTHRRKKRKKKDKTRHEVLSLAGHQRWLVNVLKEVGSICS